MEKLIKKGLIGSYSPKMVRQDLTAGLTVAAVALPQAMAYALIAGIKPEYGLYTAIVVTALSSLFSSSSHLIGGPTNAISLMVFSAVAGLTRAPEDPIAAVSLLAVFVSLIQILIALLKFGDLTRYVSESVLLGFMAGASILVALGQVPNLLGIARQGSGDDPFIYRLWLTLSSAEQINWYAAGVGAGAILAVVGLRRLGQRLGVSLPDLLIALLLASLAVWIFDWAPAEQHGVARPESSTGAVLNPEAGPSPSQRSKPATQSDKLKVIGEVPRRLPVFQIPTWRAEWLRPLSGSALAIAILGLLESLAIAKAIAGRTRQPLDFNRQCWAEGLANLGGALFRCMPGSGSLTRSTINFQAGAMTRLSGLFSALAVAMVLLLLAPAARYVPEPALAGILMVIAWRLVDRQRLRYCLRATRFDAGIALSTAAAAIFINIEFSILIGIFLSFLFFVPRAARLLASELVVSPERVIRERQPDDPQCTKMALVSLEGELFFGAAPELDEHFDELRRRVDQGVRIIVLRLKRARNPDMVCLERLQLFLEQMHERGVTVILCGVRPDFAKALENVQLHELLPADCLFLEEAATGSSTLRAVRRAYELLGNDLCPTCPRSQEGEQKADWYYMI